MTNSPASDVAQNLLYVLLRADAPEEINCKTQILRSALLKLIFAPPRDCVCAMADIKRIDVEDVYMVRHVYGRAGKLPFATGETKHGPGVSDNCCLRDLPVLVAIAPMPPKLSLRAEAIAAIFHIPPMGLFFAFLERIAQS